MPSYNNSNATASGNSDETEDYEEALEQGSEEIDISMLAHRVRHLGQLQEPLSNSVLKYNLDLPVPHTLSSGGSPVVSSLRDIERHIYTDVLGRVANRDLSGRPTQLQSQEQLQRQEQSSYSRQSAALDALDNNTTVHNDATGLTPRSLSLDQHVAGSFQTTDGEVPSPDDTSDNMLHVLPYFMQRNDNDGWQLGLDSLTDTMLSHEDLFF
jgi:hypothetical protein